ncbi:MAG: DUF362 domain-containing protein [Planctomycetia bacterium]|nr:DUF362 domain-containing protein [Planctomycetia bacterium]
MSKSQVFWTDFHATPNENLLQKMRRLIERAGFARLPMDGKFVAIKIHFGEKGNLAFVRPNFARVLVDATREHGGKPFLTDANTLYVGSRKNALDHLDVAYLNGFNPFTLGCHVIIADGLKGTDETIVPVKGQYVTEAKIGRAITDADVLITLTHVKMHECAGLGGVLKNIGMGCGSRAGKMEMHSSSKPEVDRNECIGCRACAKTCAHDAVSFDEKGKASIDKSKCAGCGRCIGRCPKDAVCASFDEKFEILNKKICEYSLAVVQGRPHFHVALVVDVSPFCDCHAENDVPVVPDVGIFASFDPIALDLACANAINAQPVIPNSALADKQTHGDYFTAMHPSTSWRTIVEYGEEIGLGSTDYDLIKI